MIYSGVFAVQLRMWSGLNVSVGLNLASGHLFSSIPETTCFMLLYLRDFCSLSCPARLWPKAVLQMPGSIPFNHLGLHSLILAIRPEVAESGLLTNEKPGILVA